MYILGGGGGKSLSWHWFLKKNLSASRPSEHPPVRRENVETFRWDHRLQRPNLFHGIQKGSPMVVTLGQQYNVGEKPTVILLTNINRHAGTPNKTKLCSTKY